MAWSSASNFLISEVDKWNRFGFVRSYSVVVGNFEQLFITIFFQTLLVEKVVLPNQTILCYNRKHIEIVRSYPLLRYMFLVYLEPKICCFFFKLLNKNTYSLNKLEIFSSKWLSSPYKTKIWCKNNLNIETKLPRVCNLKPCLQCSCSLVCDVIDFTRDVKLFKATKGNFFILPTVS